MESSRAVFVPEVEGIQEECCLPTRVLGRVHTILPAATQPQLIRPEVDKGCHVLLSGLYLHKERSAWAQVKPECVPWIRAPSACLEEGCLFQINTNAPCMPDLSWVS